MGLITHYEQAVRDAEIARIRRVLALRGMLTEGHSQALVARRFGLTQPAISYQVAKERTESVRPSDLLEAGGAVLKQIAEDRGFRRLSVFGSVARGEDRPDSDFDFLVEPPEGADLFDLRHLEEAFSKILGRDVDLVSYAGLDPELDKDVLGATVLV
jgi:predicted nucleotidyltransferase